jgi:hypothetical protein
LGTFRVEVDIFQGWTFQSDKNDDDLRCGFSIVAVGVFTNGLRAALGSGRDVALVGDGDGRVEQDVAGVN